MRTAKSRRGRFAPHREPIVYEAPRVGGALIDEQLPRYDYRDAFQVVILAPPGAVYDAVMRRDFVRLPLVRELFASRELPVGPLHRLTGAPPPIPMPKASLSDITSIGEFTRLAERPGKELVLGAVGRPWCPDYASTRLAATAFAEFQEPGYAKIAWSWIVKPLGAGQTLLVCEWRTQLTDDEARARFRRYWAAAASGVRLLARTGLARIKIDCETRS